jgi:hypothetical protein
MPLLLRWRLRRHQWPTQTAQAAGVMGDGAEGVLASRRLLLQG